MNTLMRRGFAAATTLALIVVATACGSDENNDSAATDPPASAAPDQSVSDTGAPADSAAPAELGGTIDVWIMGDAGPNFSTLVEEFTATTGIDVEVESIPWENVNDKLTTAVASGEGPDVVQFGLSNLAAFQSAGTLADLSAYAADYPSLYDATYLEAVASDRINPAGQQLSVPWISDTRVLSIGPISSRRRASPPRRPHGTSCTLTPRFWRSEAVLTTGTTSRSGTVAAGDLHLAGRWRRR